MTLQPTPLAGLWLGHSLPHQDSRGSFGRLFCSAALAPALGGKAIVQINQAVTHAAGTVRGLHFQHAPHAETKMVRCLRGRVWDVALDLRAGSPTLLQWHAVELSADNGLVFIIPEGFAHGFQALTPDCELLYLHTAAHAPQAEAGVQALDPRLAIPWPLPVHGLSPRDQAHALLGAGFQGLAALEAG